MEKLINKLGIEFGDEELLKKALTHRSYLNESNLLESNERMEFLGDAVIELVVSSYLYGKYVGEQEGILTNYRSALVKTETLANCARKLRLGEELKMSKGEEQNNGRENTSLLANTFEAVMGAIYLDQGIGSVELVLHKVLLPELEEIIRSKSYVDFKSKLQAVVQERMKVTPTYKVTKEVGPDHDKLFYVTCRAGRTELGKGEGKSKQHAEQAAAEESLRKLEIIPKG